MSHNTGYSRAVTYTTCMSHKTGYSRAVTYTTCMSHNTAQDTAGPSRTPPVCHTTQDIAGPSRTPPVCHTQHRIQQGRHVRHLYVTHNTGSSTTVTYNICVSHTTAQDTAGPSRTPPVCHTQHRIQQGRHVRHLYVTHNTGSSTTVTYTTCMSHTIQHTGAHFHLDCNRTNVLDNTNSIGHLS